LPIATEMVASVGISRCVTKRPMGRTIIQRRSHSSPVGVMSAWSTSMPRQDFTG
jgi:hypothetical protein